MSPYLRFQRHSYKPFGKGLFIYLIIQGGEGKSGDKSLFIVGREIIISLINKRAWDEIIEKFKANIWIYFKLYHIMEQGAVNLSCDTKLIPTRPVPPCHTAGYFAEPPPIVIE